MTHGGDDPLAPGGRFEKQPPPGSDAPPPVEGAPGPVEGAPGPIDEPEPRWQYEIDAEERRARRSERWERLRNVGGPVGFAALLIWKVGRIALVALGKVALLFKIPILGTVLTGLISIGAYAVFLGWPFAFGLVASLLVHELGHVVQIRREGMPVKALNFVPFLGAYVLSERATSPDQQARISIAGPVAGTGLALVLLAFAGDDELLLALAYTGFFLNLFNLLPVPILDGGGVGEAFNAGWWAIVAAALGLVALATGVAFAVLAGLAAALMAFLHRGDGFALDPHDGLPPAQRARVATVYVGVIAVCAVGMNASFRDRHDELIDRYGAAPAVAAPARL